MKVKMKLDFYKVGLREIQCCESEIFFSCFFISKDWGDGAHLPSI